ncbi:Uncharacterised protein [Escherichia coli]|uniref:Uncharacterized protein n=1 Tax=Escherichia coli TaxID=562 RepID=A0A377K4C3_ECOLX|nr:Uncharacterised protein [Escherichia coli]
MLAHSQNIELMIVLVALWSGFPQVTGAEPYNFTVDFIRDARCASAFLWDRQSSVAVETLWQTADVPGAFLNVFQEWV